jgi:magnesium chelatase subunit D
MTSLPKDPPTPWQDALLAASMIAVDPGGLTGIHVRARAGAVRDRWLEIASGPAGPGAPVRRIAAGIPATRLTGGLDIARTIESGRPVIERGVLAGADGGIVVLSMAERLEPSAAALIGSTLDDRAVRIERDGISAKQPARFALVALDEGIDDECLAAALADRMGLRIDLDRIALRETQGSVPVPAIEAARTLLPSVAIADGLIEALCAVAVSAGVGSMRAALHLMRAARVAAALRGAGSVEIEDAATALRLVLGMQASAPDDAPAQNSEPQPPPPD